MIEAGCGRILESLGAYALAALDDVEEERVRVHLATCTDCRLMLSGFRSVVAALHTLDPAEAAIGPLVPPQLDALPPTPPSP